MKKAFFKNKTPAQIRKNRLVDIAKITDVRNLRAGEYSVFEPYIPKGFENERKFMKHGKTVRPKRYHSLDQSLRDGRTPVQLREEAFDKIKSHEFCGYTFKPIGRDRRTRKVSLGTCVEGEMLYGYANQTNGTEIKVQPYADSRRVRRDGAEIIVSVPSRTEKARKHKFKLISIPVIDSPEKHIISLNFGSTHDCGIKRFNIRYTYTDDKESSGIVNICPHEIATYLQVIDFFWNERKQITPLEMSQFVMPSQRMVDYYLKLKNNTLINDKAIKNKTKLRPLNRAELEIALWSAVEEFGYDKTCFARLDRDGLVANYDWSIPK